MEWNRRLEISSVISCFGNIFGRFAVGHRTEANGRIFWLIFGGLRRGTAHVRYDVVKEALQQTRYGTGSVTVTHVRAETKAVTVVPMIKV